MADQRPMLPLDREPDLLIRPFPGRQEGPRGYLLRLAEANCMSLAELEQLGVQYQPAVLSRHRLLPDPAVDPDLHSQVGQIADRVRHKGRIWNFRHARFCPHCLAEDPTWRASWEILFHDVCPRHGVWLVDQCGSCGQAVSWQRDSLLRCQCGSDLREERAFAAPEHPRQLSAILEARLLGGHEDAVPAPLIGLDVEQVQRLIRYLGGYLDPASGSKPLKLRNAGRMEISWPVTSLAAEILYQWPVAFHDSLNRLQEAAAGKKVGLHGLFKQAYFYLYKGLKESAFVPVREAFDAWVVAYARTGVSKRNRRLVETLLENVTWIPGNVAARKLGVSPARIRHLVQEGVLEGQASLSTTGRRFLVVRNDGLAAVSQHIAAEMDMTSAMAALGLGKVRMRQLLKLLFPTARRVTGRVSMPWAIPRGEVEQLLAIGVGLPVVTIPEENQWSVAHALQFWNLGAEEVVALVEAVKAGKLNPVALDSSARGIGRWVFEINQLKSWRLSLQHTPSDWLSIPDTVIAMNSRQDVIYWLVNNHFLHAERLPKLKGIGFRVHRSEIEAFRAHYVFATEFAGQLKVSSRKLRQLLAERNIHPISGNGIDQCRQLFYARAEHLAAVVAEYTGRQGEEFRLTEEVCRSPPGLNSQDVGLSRQMGNSEDDFPKEN